MCQMSILIVQYRTSVFPWNSNSKRQTDRYRYVDIYIVIDNMATSEIFSEK